MNHDFERTSAAPYTSFCDDSLTMSSAAAIQPEQCASPSGFCSLQLGQKARDGKITIEDLQGGTFTITNGGIYGSMLSTPILNPPQSAVLGMHNIIQRPVVVDGNVEVRPVMYLALSYDHRIIDGKEAVSFLKIVKESLEQPKRLFLNI